ncbi:TetR/AcrR family transcriptional regulator [Acidipropionibacterium acidipropionici]|jgi:AcrR family transcriptional regulator|uniref:HTH tetR-type domain-containing protein n=2 Tax=Acidipropionibacterium acidipropionici TaxID=1748 RepID=A0AAC8YDG8_9ACTN|nr:TetR family transcriptional regulator [Acidipropionibacterium acidipropionici]AFV89669.1 Regulatory protein TetR [Acidipropionibacterium acidipropionici ATCC 4875]ALN16155.1 hypothetical protein ASQ49_13790 [Acidipropionibacterium acidipropionici]AMS04718.1 hypothetical protein AXH35_03670 [Acidipropionibacterium acidipropionici]AOZ46209.1 hypothetical protein A8L58_05135 [Acidipropionibacterium acidipropionici]APZ08094.1 hypothetical protein BWX38_01090 [Acidipropionibacterium acidipropion
MTDSPVTEARSAGRSAPPREGLRERKKRRTRNEIHVAALEMVLDDGLENVTVERIAERAGISPRTFFNYFPTKEAAILGIGPDSVERYADAFLARPVDEHAWESVVESVRESLNRDPERHELRRAVLFRYPELMRGLLTVFHDLRDAGTDALARRMETQGIEPGEARRLAIVYINLSSTLLLSSAQLAHHEQISSDEALDKVLTIIAMTG